MMIQLTTYEMKLSFLLYKNIKTSVQEKKKKCTVKKKKETIVIIITSFNNPLYTLIS